LSHKSLLPKNALRASSKHFRSKEHYEKELAKLQKEMVALQRRVRSSKKKMIILFEGPDAAGKGGAIERLTEKLNPKGFSVHPTKAPDRQESAQNYMERFFKVLPGPGEIAIFDRSWYGRVLVERVEGFASKKDWTRAYGEIHAIEKMWAADGIVICKIFLDISFEEQERRFTERENDPEKRWKLTKEDWRNREKWDEYRRAFQAMIQKTDSKHAPWFVIPGESKWFARVQVLKEVVKRGRKKIRPT